MDKNHKNKGGKERWKLNETIKLMNSKDYKDRFRAEYYQLKIRYEKLHKMVVKYEAES